MAVELQSAMRRLLGSEEGADYSLLCGTEEFRVHSLVLTTRSPFFKALLTNGMKETGSKSTTVTAWSPEALRLMIAFMYGGDVPASSGLTAELLELADFYMMEDLKEIATSLAKNELNQTNYRRICEVAEKIKTKDLVEECAKFLVSKAEDLDLQWVQSLPTVCLATMQLVVPKSRVLKVGDKVRVEEWQGPPTAGKLFMAGFVGKEGVEEVKVKWGRVSDVEAFLCAVDAEDVYPVDVDLKVEVAPGRWVSGAVPRRYEEDEEEAEEGAE